MIEKMIREEIKQYIESDILPRYNFFDKAHQIDHVQTVIEESIALSGSYDVDQDMVYIIAAFHDTGLCDGRERHHIVSGEILLADTFIASLFSLEQREVMRDAIEDHRASSQHAPRSIYGMIVAEADRVISTDVTLRRTVQYGLKHYADSDKEWQYTRFKDHLQKKYAEGGYLKLWIPESKNKQRLDELRQIINNEKSLRASFDAIYAEETK